ncbi:hypothetical protein A3K80_00795 [Candidatus Bathyarchaeota archaeon RBG_13_38_9]|nr:MAG: hypothetical protein A3K80_00795 [Candidatus Bathyarchaeota archaeon RBG_13_38_9]
MGPMKHEQLLLLFFMGLILGSIPSIVAHSRLKSLRVKEIFTIGISLILILALGMFRSTEPFLGAYVQDFTPLILFLVSIVAGGAMIVPGVSGSLVFLMFGQYTVMVEAVNEIASFPCNNRSRGHPGSFYLCQDNPSRTNALVFFDPLRHNWTGGRLYYRSF